MRSESDRLEALQRAVEDSLKPGEFPLTDMSRALARALWKTRLPKGAALDVGTGSGYHAFLLALKGNAPVLAIDRCAAAIRNALDRARLVGVDASQAAQQEVRAAIHRQARAAQQTALFSVVDYDNLPELHLPQFSMIAFNPPGYYYSQRPDYSMPAAYGVYAGSEREAGDPKGSHLYRFFKNVVLPLLALEGHVLCAWPGLERRVVERFPTSVLAGTPVHPAVLLREWFALKITGVEVDADAFYGETATLRSDYGLGKSFWDDLERARRHYSRLFLYANSARGGAPTFRFGILHLRRVRVDTFEVVSDQ